MISESPSDIVGIRRDRLSDAELAKVYRDLEGLIGDLHSAYKLSELTGETDENLRVYAHNHLGDIVKTLYEEYYDAFRERVQ